MIPHPSTRASDADENISSLIGTFLRTERRLEELTAGEVDTVSDGDGRAFLLRRAQEQLRLSEAGKQAAIINALPAHIALLDGQGMILSVNEAWRRFAESNALGAAASGLGQNYLEICERARGPCSEEAHEAAVGIRAVLSGAAGEFSLEYPCHSPTQQRWFQLRASPVEKDGARGGVVMHVDITARRLAEAALRESQQRFSGAFEFAPIGVSLVSLEGRWLKVNRALCEVVGYSEAELLALTFQHLTHSEDLEADLEKMRRLLTGTIRAYQMEKRYFHARGHLITVLVNVSLVRDSGGQPLYFVAQVQDITERKRVEAALVSKQAELQMILDTVPAIIFHKDRQHRFLGVNAAGLRAHGRPVGDFIGKTDAELGLPHAEQYVRDEEEIAATGQPKRDIIEPVLTATGTRWFQTDKVPIRDAAGAVTGFIGFSLDITERKLAEEALRESEGRLRFLHALAEATRPLADSEQIMAVTARMLGEHLRASRCAYADVERDGEQFSILNDYTDGCASTVGRYQLSHFGTRAVATLNCGQTLMIRDVDAELLPDDGADMFRALGIQAIITCPLVKEGCLRAMMAVHQVTPRDWQPGEIALVKEVVERCWATIGRSGAEKALKESEQRFAGAFEYAPIGVALVSPDGRWLKVNRALCDLVGYSEAELLARTFQEITHPEDLAADLECVRRLLAEEIRFYAMEKRYVHARGHFVTVLLNVSLVRDGEGRPLYFIAQMQDITERKQVERETRFNEQRFRSLVEATASIVWDTPASGEFEVAQPGWSAFTGQRFEEYRGWGWLDCIHPDDREETVRVWSKAVSSRTIYAVEHRLRRADKVYSHMVVRGVPILAADGTILQWIGIHTDVTAQKNLEQQFLRAQRMESIGTLAGGIAHDLNNALAPIIMSGDLLRTEMSEPDRLEIISTIETSARRCADMVSQILSFARGVEGRRMVVQLSHLLRELRHIANDTFPKNIKVTTRIDPHGWTVLGDSTQLHQVLLNLCINARDALPAGGSITLSSENVTLDESYASMNLEAEAGPYVLLQVQDTGTGVPPEIIERIFDPFFTTKEVGKGTGLGLSTSLAIVQSHGGFIRVYSEPGRGTNFKVYLPANVTDPVGDLSELEKKLPRGDGEKILVADDEVFVREITRQTLESFGYRVLLASDGAEAIALYAQHKADIAVVLTDMMMPVMDGPATIRVLLKINPEVKIVAASGIADNHHIAKAAVAGVTHFLSKPYTAETLLKMLQKVLGRATA